MKKAHTVSNIYIALSLLAVPVFSGISYAADSYYIEIGKPGSVEETHEEWSDISTKYKSLLGKLNFYPKASINQQGETTNTIQAGPINEKSKAQKICNKLFSKQIQCFVIEGIEKKPPTMSIRMSQASSAPDDSIFQWHNETQAPQVIETQPQPMADNGASGVAKVDVAQAIPVPLSSRPNDDGFVDITKSVKQQSSFEPKFVPQDSPEVRGGVQNFSVDEFSALQPGTLVVKGFSSEAQASKFWNYVNSEFPDMANGLRVSIQRPLVANNRGVALIKVSPFASGEAAGAFCQQAVGSFGVSLECHYEINRQAEQNTGNNRYNRAEIDGDNENDVFESQHNNAYTQRRQLSQRRIPVQQMAIPRHESSIIDIQELPQQGKTYFAQVAISESKGEANHRWADIKKKNASTVKGVDAKLATSSSSYAKYSMRLGSFDSEDAANKLCDKLQARGVDCLVVSGQ